MAASFVGLLFQPRGLLFQPRGIGPVIKMQRGYSDMASHGAREVFYVVP